MRNHPNGFLYKHWLKNKEKRKRRRPIFLNALLKCWMINAPSSNFSFHIRRSTLVDPLSYLHLNLESSVKRLKRALFARWQKLEAINTGALVQRPAAAERCYDSSFEPNTKTKQGITITKNRSLYGQIKVCNRLLLFLNVLVSLHSKTLKKIGNHFGRHVKTYLKVWSCSLNILAINHEKDTSVTFQDVT